MGFLARGEAVVRAEPDETRAGADSLPDAAPNLPAPVATRGSIETASRPINAEISCSRRSAVASRPILVAVDENSVRSVLPASTPRALAAAPRRNRSTIPGLIRTRSDPASA